MVNAIDPDPQVHHGHSPDSSLHHHYAPRKGDAVEVCTDEEGFVGAWFPATIKFFSKKRKKNAVVRYDTLVSDENSRIPLTESVDPAFVRPVPPPPPGNDGVKYAVNDVVDAWYKDGWWYGVVRKVHEGNRYRVLFDNPPDAIDFEAVNLRAHLDWVSGKWVRPKKKRTLEGVFSLGTEVEVNLDQGKVGDAWFPAIVIKQNGDETFLVKRESWNSCDDGEPKVDMQVVDSTHMRLPPCKLRWDYELMDPVNANIDGHWQKGKITRVCIGGRYTVLFPQKKEYREFSWWSLRPDFQRDDGGRKTESKAESKEIVIALRSQGEVDSHYTAANNLEPAVTPVSPHPSNNHPKEKTPSSVATRIVMVDDSAVHAKRSALDDLTSSKKKKLKLDIFSPQLLHKNVKEVETREACLSATKQKETSSGPDKETLPDQMTSKMQRERVTKPKSSLDCDQLSAETKKRQANIHNLHCQKVAIVTSNEDRDCNPEDDTITDSNEAGGVQKEDRPPVNLGLGAVGQSPEYGKLNPSENQKKESETPGELSSEHNQQESGERKRESPGKLYLIPSLTEDGKGLCDGKHRQVDPATNLVVLPFVKRSPAWQLLESMEVFKNISQKPHFLPLMECSEDYREGTAIGMMVTFSNLFEKISNLRIHDARALFDSTLINLSNLESHGFDVTVPRDRINKLLLIQEPLSKWLNVVMNSEKELHENDEERKNLFAMIEEIAKQISALQQKEAEAKAKVDAKEARAAVVRSQVDEMKVCINNACNEFERVAASPWY
ncbi:unnamed protein product [Linum tenue]|uniref:Agenet domain-containing protein n=1 Tax=Linum tenue TaxID=586396 RepID=A0AAV0KVG2_9ROSI|nr:unnamed protein product [Linum tenue]